MTRSFLLLVLVWVGGAMLAGCDRPPPPPPPIDDIPPDGSAHYLDADGVGRTLLTPLSTLSYGDRVAETLPPPAALSGYEFAGSAGDRPTIILDVQGAARVSLALYGRRDDTGLWGRPLVAVSDAGVLRIPEVELPADGYYFILVRLLAGEPVPYDLALDCPDCVDPLCPAVDPCDLFCAQGYADGDDGCRRCACQAQAACMNDAECLADEECIDGVCRPAATCIDRCADVPLDPVCDGQNRTWPNRCVAECEAAGEVQPGECVDEGCSPDRPCPEGQICRNGRCVCDCPPDQTPVCAESGETFSNLCQLECAGETLDYAAPCDGPPLTVQCVDDDGCPQGQVCAGGGDGPGICTAQCRPEVGCGRLACTSSGDRFVCLPPCTPEGRCREPLQCLPDVRGIEACIPCDCPAGGEPVCAGERLEYPSRCAARCAGVADERLAPGPCENAPAEVDCRRCPRDWAPVCADGQIRATACDAECGARPAGAVEDHDMCFRAPPTRGCAVDEDCELTGDDGTVCAAEPTDARPTLGPEARCFTSFGACGCIEGVCGFRPARREIDRCLERARMPRL